MQVLPGRGARPGGGVGVVHGSTWRLPSWLSAGRLLAMTALIKTDHTEFWKLHLHPSLDWPEIVNPLILLLSYYTLVLLLPQRAPQPGVSCPQRAGTIYSPAHSYRGKQAGEQILTRV